MSRLSCKNYDVKQSEKHRRQQKFSQMGAKPFSLKKSTFRRTEDANENCKLLTFLISLIELLFSASAVSTAYV